MPEGTNQGPDQTDGNSINAGIISNEGSEPLVTHEVVSRKLLNAHQLVRANLGPKALGENIDNAIKDAIEATSFYDSNPLEDPPPDLTELHGHLVDSMAVSPWARPSPGQEERELERRDFAEVEDVSELSIEQTPDFVRLHVEQVFPELTGMSDGAYRTYVKGLDGIDVGRPLHFYPGGKRTDGVPIVTLNFRDGEGFTILYWNASNFPENKTPGPEMKSVYREDGKKFQLDQVGEALVRAKKIIYGGEEGDTTVLDHKPEGKGDYDFVGPDHPDVQGL